ncbi:MAG: 4-(cytidine 5'-diphospho)-2-C-methyl-D-erythritol kinase [Bacillota bacterium]|nr:4-(cytidine 5'-diphospho)-2-C-methyl-D-erythritol kinase [Bacillota bacterium]NLL60013.1 4-(cytidine 5'-diphospho)-2-C-methyl-D-erythritol kinase [Tissierellia bacterium]
MKLKSYGKINLFLDVKGKLPSGYHDIVTVIQSIDIYDEITLKPVNEDKIIIECSDLSIPVDESNTCFKAAMVLKDTFGINSGIHIYIDKKIPAGAGMGGGSSNAAAVIKGLNALWKLNLSREELSAIGVRVGADVPFCLVGGTCLAEGIGDKVTDLNDFLWNDILLVKPEFSISTAFIYKNLKSDYYNLYDSSLMLRHLSSHDHESTARSVSNTLEKVVEIFHPQIKDIKGLMIDNGAISSIMTGSGSTVFGLFKDSTSLNKAYDLASGAYPFTFKTKTNKDGVKFID